MCVPLFVNIFLKSITILHIFYCIRVNQSICYFLEIILNRFNSLKKNTTCSKMRLYDQLVHK